MGVITFKGEKITLPDMPDDFKWDQDQDQEVDFTNIRQRNPGGERAVDGWEVIGYVSIGRLHKAVVRLSRLGTSDTVCILETHNLQEAIDVLAIRAMLGGADHSELP